MNKKYVLSASEFSSKAKALAKIRQWDKENALENPRVKVYEIVKKFETVLSLKEVKLRTH